MSAGLNISLPKPGAKYDPRNEAETRRLIELAFLRIAAVTGTGGGGTSTPAATRREVILTTGSVASGAEEQGTIDMGAKTQMLLLIESDRACRLRFYATSAARATDLSRGTDADPPAGRGVQGEFIWQTSHQKIVNFVDLFNADDPVTNTIYYTYKNLSGSTGTATITMTVLTLEA